MPLLIANWCKDFLALISSQCQYHPVSLQLKHTILVLPFCVGWNSLFQDFFNVVILLCGAVDVRYFCRTFCDLFFPLHVLCKSIPNEQSLFSRKHLSHTHTHTHTNTHRDHLLCMGHNTWQGFLLILHCWSGRAKSLLPCLDKWACIFPRPGGMIIRVLCKMMATWNIFM